MLSAAIDVHYEMITYLWKELSCKVERGVGEVECWLVRRASIFWGPIEDMGDFRVDTARWPLNSMKAMSKISWVGFSNVVE